MVIWWWQVDNGSEEHAVCRVSPKTDVQVSASKAFVETNNHRQKIADNKRDGHLKLCRQNLQDGIGLNKKNSVHDTQQRGDETAG